MQQDPFAERLAKVRQRFASTLETKIDDSFAALPQLDSGDDTALAKLGDTYRKMHHICGVGPTIGFAATAKAARAAEDILITPFKTNRCLTAEETARLKAALDALQAAARAELQTIASQE